MWRLLCSHMNNQLDRIISNPAHKQNHINWSTSECVSHCNIFGIFSEKTNIRKPVSDYHKCYYTVCNEYLAQMMCFCVPSMCCVSHVVWGGRQWCQQQGEERRRGGRGGQRWHVVWCGALPGRAERESPAALPSPASGLHTSRFEFISNAHKHTHIQCVSFNGCLTEQHSRAVIHPALLLLFQAEKEGFELCAYVSVCVYWVFLCACSISLTSRAPILREQCFPFFCLPTFHFGSSSFLLFVLAAMFLTVFLSEKWFSCSHIPAGHLSFSSPDLGYIPAMLSVTCLLLHRSDMLGAEVVALLTVTV